MLIMLVTTIGFTSFSFAPESTQLRCQLTSLLLLTLVNFRWILSNSLPSISYLTLLDKYSIGSLLFLFAFFLWHSFLAYFIEISGASNASFDAKLYDTYMFYGFICLYSTFNFTFILLICKILRSIKFMQKKK